MTRAFKVIRADRAADKSLVVGQLIYSCKSHDYGVSSDDTRMTGIKHVSMTLDKDGGYPFFTIPEADFVAAVEEDIVPTVEQMGEMMNMAEAIESPPVVPAMTADSGPLEAQALSPVTQAISLKDRRERLGLTLRDVEEISKGSISNSYLSQLETGKIKNPSLENARLLANIYHCQTDDIAEALSLPILTALLRDRIHAALTPSALSGDTRGKCKADLTALEQAFRAGYAACLDHADPPGPIFYKGTPNEAWAEFLSNEMRALG